LGIIHGKKEENKSLIETHTMHYVMQDTTKEPFFVDSIQYEMVFSLLRRRFVGVVINLADLVVLVVSEVAATSQRLVLDNLKADYYPTCFVGC
jgi:hypothetical protein